MTTFHNIQRVTVEFTNRDNVATRLIVEPGDQANADIVVSHDGLSAEFNAWAILENNGKEWRFENAEDLYGNPEPRVGWWRRLRQAIRDERAERTAAR